MKNLLLLLLCVPLFSTPIKTYSVKPTLSLPHPHNLKMKPVTGGRVSSTNLRLSIPSSLDYRSKISPAGDQGQCESCYAWGGAAITLTDELMVAGIATPVLSPQYFMDASGNGCEGGWLDVGKLAVSPKGAPSLASYPYQGRDQSLQKVTNASSASGWSYVGNGDIPPTTQDLKAALVEHGPLASVMFAGQADFQTYSSGVFNDCVPGASPDHAIEIVAYTDRDTWIVKNSWGKDWGMNGYFEIPFGCGIGQEASFFFIKKRKHVTGSAKQ